MVSVQPTTVWVGGKMSDFSSGNRRESPLKRFICLFSSEVGWWHTGSVPLGVSAGMEPSAFRERLFLSLIINNFSPFGVIGRIWLGTEAAKRGDYCLNGTGFVALSQRRAILFAFNISKKSNNALREVPLYKAAHYCKCGTCLDC